MQIDNKSSPIDVIDLTESTSVSSREVVDLSKDPIVDYFEALNRDSAGNINKQDLQEQSKARRKMLEAAALEAAAKERKSRKPDYIAPMDTEDTISLPYLPVTSENSKKHTYFTPSSESNPVVIGEASSSNTPSKKKKKKQKKNDSGANNHQSPHRSPSPKKNRRWDSPRTQSPGHLGKQQPVQQMMQPYRQYAPFPGVPAVTGAPFSHAPMLGYQPRLPESSNQHIPRERPRRHLPPYNPRIHSPLSVRKINMQDREKRYIVIDGSNMAME